MTAMARATEAASMLRRKKFGVTLIIVQTVLIVLFALFSRYRDDPMVIAFRSKMGAPTGHLTGTGNAYTAWQDMQMMTVVGFAMMAAFLKRYAASSMGYTMLLVAIVMQWGVFVHEMIVTRFQGVMMGMDSLITGNLAAVTVLISFGAVMGKMGPMQLLTMAMFEVIFYSINKYIGNLIFEASDFGHSMYTHMFGAIFGLMIGRINYKDWHGANHPQNTRTYYSDTFAAIGTLLLWVCFPGFNAAFAPEALRQRALVNTVMALVCSTVATYICTVFMSKDQKFNVVHMQNAVLAGGVAIGCTACTCAMPYMPMVIGTIAGCMAVFSMQYKQPCMLQKLGFHDTRMVMSVHGVPAFFGAIMSIIIAGATTMDTFGQQNLYLAYPAMVPMNTTDDAGVREWVRNGQITFGIGRNGGRQALFQFYTMLATIGVAIVGGAFTGLLMAFKFCDAPNSSTAFDDQDYWTVSTEGMPLYEQYTPTVTIEMAETGNNGTTNNEDTTKLKTAEEGQNDEKPTETDH